MLILDQKEQLRRERQKNEELKQKAVKAEAVTSYNIMMGNLEDPEEEEDE